MILCTFNSDGQCVSVAQVADTDERTISLLTQDSNCFEIPEPKRMGSIYLDHGVVKDIPARPSPHHVFNYTTKQWEDPRTLDDLKASQWTQIKQARTQAEFGTFIYNGMGFDGDVNAQRRLASYISVSKSAIASGMPFQAEFILANNSVVLLTAQDFVGIEMAKVQQVALAFAHAVQLRAQIDAATTKEEVEAVVW